ncbi:hypothetical protein ACG94O_10415 [Acinetobacter ursingii]|uniref:hypothetical protein n=1 Tax=Acinetobacter ursingii TaxID=108980 RepID=UPI003AF60D00
MFFFRYLYVFFFCLAVSGCGGASDQSNSNNSNVVDNRPIVLSFGSSTFEYMNKDLETNLKDLGYNYISDSIGGQIIETMQAHEGSNPIRISFNETNLQLGNTYNINWNQEFNIGHLKANGKFNVTLENGLKGELDLNRNLFKVDNNNTTTLLNIKNNSLLVDFNYSNYIKNSIVVINIGKNNLSNRYSAEQILNGIKMMTDYLEKNKNYNYIVVGFFVDTDGNNKEQIIKTNNLLSQQYGNKFFNVEDYISSQSIWADVNIRPNNQDLESQENKNLPVSLSRNNGHLNNIAGKALSIKIAKKISALYTK